MAGGFNPNAFDPAGFYTDEAGSGAFSRTGFFAGGFFTDPAPNGSITFSPASGELLIDAQEDEINQTATITASENPAFFYWNVVPALDMTVTKSGADFTINVPDFVETFPIIEIRYRRNGIINSVLSWDDLPADAEELIAALKDAAGVKDHVLTLTVVASDGSESTGYFIIRAHANYTPWRDRIAAEVDARR